MGWVTRTGIGGLHCTAAAAARALRRADDDAAAEDEQPRPKRWKCQRKKRTREEICAHKSTYQHVFWHRGKSSFVAVLPGDTRKQVAGFHTDIAAAKHAAEHWGVNYRDLKQDSSPDDPGQAKLRFKTMYNIYKEIGTPLPGDLEHALRAGGSSRAYAAPATFVVWLLMRLPDHRSTWDAVIAEAPGAMDAQSLHAALAWGNRPRARNTTP